MKPARLLPALLLLAGCAAPYQVVDSYRGQELSLSELADQLQDSDVVIIGENHRSDEGHVAQIEVVRTLHRRRPDLVISMEMFERDVQLVLWQYLVDDIDEEQFLAESRPWSNYERHYRPLIEYAKANRLPVIAANVPRPLAARVAREGLGSVRDEIHAAKRVSAPRNRYWERFQAAMSSHPGAFDGEEAMYRAYQAQCLKDDTMAESIADYLQTARSEMREPLVVHINGSFHSDYGLGVVARVRQRAPGAVVALVSTLQSSDRREAFLTSSDPPAEYVILVPDVPPPALPAAAVATSDGEDAGEDGGDGVAEVEEVSPAESRPASRPLSLPARPVLPADPDARPALGIRPDYEFTGEGVRIAALREDGPAARAGIHEGDILLGVAQFHVADLEQYTEILSMLRVGEEVEVVVRRGGMIRRVGLTVGKR